jgi:GTP diphosphokinase / guanosine-3',5'-bis(diphosphate) 3'-diphosphatase
VNYKLVPLSYILKTGDQVEIITSRVQKPREEWLRFAATAKARSAIKEAIKEERKAYYDDGKEKLQKLLKQHNIEFNRANLSHFQQFHNIKGIIDLYYFVSAGKIGIREVRDAFPVTDRGLLLNLITRPFTRNRSLVDRSLSEKIIEQIKNRPEEMVIDSDSNNVDFEVSSCCNPIPGDDVIGLITYNEPVKLHRVNCPEALQLMSKYGNRIVKAKWNNKDTIGFLTGIKLSSIDKQGLINEITGIISGQMNLNIRSFHLDSNGEISEAYIMLYVSDVLQLNALLDDLRKIRGVKRVARIDHPEEAFS